MIALTEGNSLSLKKREGERPSRGELLELWFSISFLGHNKRAMTTAARISMTPITAIAKNSINKDKDEDKDKDKEEGSGDYYVSGSGFSSDTRRATNNFKTKPLKSDKDDEDKDKHDYDYDLYL